MGKIILCNGVRTTKAYYFDVTGTRIYSIEELAYYIYNNIYYLDAKFIKNDLIEWIGYNLKLNPLSDKLYEQKKQNVEFKEMIITILKASNYYNSLEIKNLMRIVDEISKMKPIEKRCYRAKRYLGDKNYVFAFKEYESIIKSEEINMVAREQMGDIMHNFAITILYTQGIGRTVPYFLEAYELNNNKVTLYYYLYCIFLHEDRDKFDEEVEKFDLSREETEQIMDYIRILQNEADEKIDFKGKVLNSIIDKWKAEMR